MRKTFVSLFFLLIFALAAFSQTTPKPPTTHLKVGDAAPDFTLTDTAGKPVKLSDFKGKKNVVLAFYVLAFTGGWTKELQAYQADIAKFEATDTVIYGISMDSFVANKRFAEDIKVTIPLLSDWKRKTTIDYGLYNEESGYGARGTFVIDKEGKIQHIELGRTAIDPTGAYQVCDLLTKKKETKNQ